MLQAPSSAELLDPRSDTNYFLHLFAAVQLLGVVCLWSGPRILSGPGPVPFGVGLVLLASLPQDPVVIRIVRGDGPDMRDRLGKLLLVLGLVLAAAGAVLLVGGKLPFRLGRLPGDIVYQGRHTSFYFPIVTCILLSVALTLIFWLISIFRR